MGVAGKGTWCVGESTANGIKVVYALEAEGDLQDGGYYS